MKILRVRRGYTTNSSAASEFIPPSDAPAGTSSGNQTAGTAAPATAGPTTVAMPAGPAATVTVAPAAPVTAAPVASGWSNSAMLGGLAGLVVLAFVAERVLRWGIDRIRRGRSGEQ